MDALYTDLVLDHYRHPRHSGALPHSTHTASAANPLCGDIITAYLEIKNGNIRTASYDSQGCALSIASASLLFEAIQKKSVKEVRAMKPSYVVELLHAQLTPSRLKCALLPLEAIQRALKS